jgi:hypothetical protein
MIAAATTDRVFIVFAILVGIAAGAVYAWVPQSRSIGLAPYFWVLIAFALFEGIAVYLRGGGAQPLIAMSTRLIGFVIALALMAGIPMAAGVEMKLF